jgi:hypothetical protein
MAEDATLYEFVYREYSSLPEFKLRLRFARTELRQIGVNPER